MRRLAAAIVLLALAAQPLVGQTRLIANPRSPTLLQPVAPTGPAPAGFTVTATPLVAQLRWSPAASVAAYALWRTDAPGATPTERTPAGFQGTSFADTVPDPRLTYAYRLVVNYANGTWGEAQLTFVSPPPTNPTRLIAQRLAPDQFDLRWTAVPGAADYRLDGPTLPNTGLLVRGLSATLPNVPAGPQTWQIVAIFPGNYADYATPRRVSAVSRPLPPHSPWLTKPNGVGDERTAEYHAQNSCQTIPFGFRCKTPVFHWSGDDGPTNGDILRTYGLAAGNSDTEPPGEVHYTNVTELGSPRSANCFEARGQSDQYTICYTSHGVVMAMIIKGSKGGARFLAFGPTSWVAWKDRWKLTSANSFGSEGGGKYTPHVCTSCHGGIYDQGSGLVMGGTLLPIDPGLVQVANRPAQEEGIRRINEMVLRSGASPAVQAYIHGLYGGRVSVPGATAVASYVPSGWASDVNFYLGVVKKDCQMCHLATRPGLDFLSAGNFRANQAIIYASVCQAKTMPHSAVPFRNFWQEDTGALYKPGLFAAWLGYASCP